MVGNELTKRICKSRMDSVGVRGIPPMKWEDRVLEYLRERKDRRLIGVENTRVECMDRRKWRLLLCPSPWGSSQKRVTE